MIIQTSIDLKIVKIKADRMVEITEIDDEKGKGQSKDEDIGKQLPLSEEYGNAEGKLQANQAQERTPEL